MTQQDFFDTVRDQFNGSKKDLVLTLAQLIGVNADGVYRRLRGETPLTLEEAMKIASQFGVSFSQGFNASYTASDDTNSFLETVKDFLLSYREAGPYTLYLDAKELPIFYLFHFPSLYAFKQAFWGRMFFGTGDFGVSNAISPVQKELLELYEQLPSTELWGESIIRTTIQQIDYASDIDLVSQQEGEGLFEDLLGLMDKLESYCERGRKAGGGQLLAYFNNVLIGDNSVIVEQGGEVKASFLSENIIDLYEVKDPLFNRRKFELFNNAIRKSTAISVSSEKARKRYFNQLRAEVAQSRAKLAI